MAGFLEAVLLSAASLNESAATFAAGAVKVVWHEGLISLHLRQTEKQAEQAGWNMLGGGGWWGQGI